MSIGSPFVHPPQMPSKKSSRLPYIKKYITWFLGDYARQVLDNALADLMECSMWIYVLCICIDLNWYNSSQLIVFFLLNMLEAILKTVRFIRTESHAMNKYIWK